MCEHTCTVYCGKTADRTWMQFGMVGRMGAGMRQVVRFGDRSMRGVILGANVARPIVNSGQFAA